jgi:uncharacterized protein YxeA
MTGAIQIKILAAILAVLCVVGAAYLRNSRRDQQPGYVLTEQDKQQSKKLAQSPPTTYLEP